MSAKRAEALLERLVECARNERPPQLDAAAIEAAVFARVTRSSVDSIVVLKQRSRRYLWAATALAAAAALAIVATRFHSPAAELDASPHRGRIAQDSAIDGALLGLDQVLEAHDSDLVIRHGSIAIWRLSAKGRAHVVENGPRVSIALERGRIDAEVVPQLQPETFAVEVERTRVAVHGTVFSVERRGDTADIIVKEGSVRLGSVEKRGSNQGPLIEAPTRMSVDITPVRHEADAVSPRPHAAPRALLPSAAKPIASAPEAAKTAQPNLPERPTAGETERVWELVAQTISECFASNTTGDPNVRVSFGTQVNIRLAPDGAVSVGSLNPPVPQAVFECYESRLSQLTTPATVEGATVSRPKVLTR